MPALGGANGTVNSCTHTDTASSASVTYPGPPPHTEVYSDLTADEYATFLAAFAGSAQVNVTVDGAGSLTSVSAHR